MRLRFRHKEFACLAVMMLGLVGFASTNVASASSRANSSKNPIIIGVDYDDSGAASPTSIPGYQGIQAAVQTINKAGGVLGRPFKLIAESDNDLATNAPIVVNSLISQGAVAILMDSASPSFLQVKPILEADKIPALTPINTNPTIPLPPNNDYAYVQVPSTTDYTQEGIQALQKLGVTKVGLVFDSAPADQLNVPITQQLMAAAGIQVVDTETIQVSATNTSASMARIVQAGAQAIYIGTEGGPVELAMYSGAYQADPNLYKIITNNCSDSESHATQPAALNGAICLTQVTLTNPRTHAASAVLRKILGATTYKSEYLSTQLYQGFQGPYTFMKAIELGHGATSADIEKGMQKITNLKPYFGGPNFSLTYTTTEHTGGSKFNCAYAALIFKGNIATSLWSKYQPKC